MTDKVLPEVTLTVTNLPNRNNRIYSDEIMQSAIDALGNNPLWVSLPDEVYEGLKTENIVGHLDNLRIEDSQVVGECTLMHATRKGPIVIETVQHTPIYFAMAGTGIIKEKEGQTYVEDFVLTHATIHIGESNERNATSSI